MVGWFVACFVYFTLPKHDVREYAWLLESYEWNLHAWYEIDHGIVGWWCFNM